MDCRHMEQARQVDANKNPDDPQVAERFQESV